MKKLIALLLALLMLSGTALGETVLSEEAPHLTYEELEIYLNALADKLIETAEDVTNGTFFISHGDCEEDARFLADAIKSKGGNDVQIITNVGTVIGAHSGPGTMALFFLAKQR